MAECRYTQGTRQPGIGVVFTTDLQYDKEVHTELDVGQ